MMVGVFRKSVVGSAAMMTGLAAMMTGLAATSATAKDPDFLPGTDPGGLAIALVGPGIDYTAQGISKRLARDGEGTPIGWDFVDGDHKPFAASKDAEGQSGIATAEALLKAYKKSRLIVLRVTPTSDGETANALAMASKMPSRIVAVPDLPSRNGAEMTAAIAARARHVLYVVPALNGWTEDAPKNVVRVAPISEWEFFQGSGVDVWLTEPGAGLFGDLIIRSNKSTTADKLRLAVARAAANAACAQHGGEAKSGADARALLQKLARPSKTRPGVLVHDPLCFYGGKVFKH